MLDRSMTVAARRAGTPMPSADVHAQRLRVVVLAAGVSTPVVVATEGLAVALPW